MIAWESLAMTDELQVNEIVDITSIFLLHLKFTDIITRFLSTKY